MWENKDELQSYYANLKEMQVESDSRRQICEELLTCISKMEQLKCKGQEECRGAFELEVLCRNVSKYAVQEHKNTAFKQVIRKLNIDTATVINVVDDIPKEHGKLLLELLSQKKDILLRMIENMKDEIAAYSAELNKVYDEFEKWN